MFISSYRGPCEERIPRPVSCRTTSTGRCMSSVIRRITPTREVDPARDPAPARPRCASASLNDNLVDISFLQQLCANRVQPAPPKRSCMQTLDVDAVANKHAAAPEELADHLQATNRCCDLRHDQDRLIDLNNIDRDLIHSPHIRESRIVQGPRVRRSVTPASASARRARRRRRNPGSASASPDRRGGTPPPRW